MSSEKAEQTVSCLELKPRLDELIASAVLFTNMTISSRQVHSSWKSRFENVINCNYGTYSIWHAMRITFKKYETARLQIIRTKDIGYENP